MDPQAFGVSRSLFLKWRTPRFGRENPTRMDNAVWEWLIRSRISAYQAAQKFVDTETRLKGPTWCFDRVGQSVTELPDGRRIFIAGEHEDYYDPDFYIYNDVVVIYPDETIEIYGYPEDIFPATDFHSATLLDDRIVVIGSLGNRDKRTIGQTQVYQLDLNSLEMREVQTMGTSPGWIHQHAAALANDGQSITITQGLLYLGRDQSLIENIDDWQLDLNDWRWQRLTERRWTRWLLRRSDQRPNHLWSIRQALFDRNMKWRDTYEEAIQRLTVELGQTPDIDQIKELYSPPIAHTQLPQQEYNVFRIEIDGVVVRCVENLANVQVTIEGDLPADVIDKLQTDIFEKFSLLENASCELEKIG